MYCFLYLLNLWVVFPTFWVVFPTLWVVFSVREKIRKWARYKPRTDPLKNLCQPCALNLHCDTKISSKYTSKVSSVCSWEFPLVECNFFDWLPGIFFFVVTGNVPLGRCPIKVSSSWIPRCHSSVMFEGLQEGLSLTAESLKQPM